ncbi:hypothetical protein [Parenemella sanctibonifatiensis]|uniref:Uncharacterized protein n=1 Tax=Parenemella sanctibonifatiensis TaxID=2016505 RepID=A0A255E388_9ACTN|nr:hypothetical protein [Parenemella sanctibonifatiensis]OYN83995.1 hypothetical protein CGZ92_13110 [Parenemella sanctibonifatiensis]OYN90263.1 hypothetical protein CGZ91_08855 [Parenemella sanctibonifatiensis]
MALNKKPSVANAGRRYTRAQQEAAAGEGIDSTFRADDDQTKLRKTTVEFAPTVFQALKLHAVRQDVPMRVLLDRYVRDGLEKDGAPVNEGNQ